MTFLSEIDATNALRAAHRELIQLQTAYDEFGSDRPAIAIRVADLLDEEADLCEQSAAARTFASLPSPAELRREAAEWRTR